MELSEGLGACLKTHGFGGWQHSAGSMFLEMPFYLWLKYRHSLVGHMHRLNTISSTALTKPQKQPPGQFERAL